MNNSCMFTIMRNSRNSSYAVSCNNLHSNSKSCSLTCSRFVCRNSSMTIDRVDTSLEKENNFGEIAIINEIVIVGDYENILFFKKRLKNRKCDISKLILIGF